MKKRITVNYINSLTSTQDLQNVYESLSVDAYYIYQSAKDHQAIWDRVSFINLQRRWEAAQSRMSELHVLDMDGQKVSTTNFGNIIA